MVIIIIYAKIHRILYVIMFIILAASKNYDNKDCVVVVILSHGDPNIVYANDQPYNPKSLWSKFCPLKNPTLKGNYNYMLLTFNILNYNNI